MLRTVHNHRTSFGRRQVLRVLLALMMLGPAWTGGSARLRSPRTAEPAPELTWTTDSRLPQQATLRQGDFTALPAIRPKKGDFRSVWKLPAPGAAAIPEILADDDPRFASGIPQWNPGTALLLIPNRRCPRGPPHA